MKKLLLLLVLAVVARATEPVDLGLGLSYLRIHSARDAETAGPKVRSGTGALVLDLRYMAAGEDPAAALKSLLAARPAGSPLFVLVGPTTPPALAKLIGSALTLGAPGSLPAPKVVVQTDAATDRRAYDALDTGTPLDSLISGKIDKERYDEATLVEDFNNGDRDAEPPETPDPTEAKTGDPAPKEARLVDRVLQRAVQLHRALLALRR